MRSLRASVIRLAWEVPELRPRLLLLLREAARSRVALRIKQFQALLSKGKQFGVLSAYGPGSKKQNQIRHGQLVADLQRMGYRWENLRGSWEGVTEKSVLVKNMRFPDLLKLGLKFDQDAVIFKDPSGTIGMYYQRDGVAEVAVKPDGDMAAQIQADPELYSKARGVSFEFGFLWGQRVPWDKRTPLSKSQVEELFVS